MVFQKKQMSIQILLRNFTLQLYKFVFDDFLN